MRAKFTKYKLQLVKEKTNIYEVNNIIQKPEDIFEVAELLCNISEEAEEVLILICLNSKNKVIGVFEVARGSICECICNNREILKRAVLANSAGIAVIHNHPSGYSDPSRDDIKSTKNLNMACELFGITFIDHIILGENELYSFKKADKVKI